MFENIYKISGTLARVFPVKYLFHLNSLHCKQSPKNVQSFLGTKFGLRTFLTHIFTNYGNLNTELCDFITHLSNTLTFMLILPYFLEFSSIIKPWMLTFEEIVKVWKISWQPSSLLKPSWGTWFLGSPYLSDSGLQAT